MLCVLAERKENQTQALVFLRAETSWEATKAIASMGHTSMPHWSMPNGDNKGNGLHAPGHCLGALDMLK